MTGFAEFVWATMGDALTWTATALVIYTTILTLRDAVTAASRWYRDRE